MAQTAAIVTFPAIEDLRPGKQWVCFDIGKLPYNPLTGSPVSGDLVAGNPSWGTCEQAQNTLARNPQKYRGIGREFIKEQGITGVDLDHCIDEHGNLSAWARFAVNLLDSYTEISPSGRGLHIWVYGTIEKSLAPSKELDGDMATEAYDSGHYFTITGNHFEGTPITLEHRQEALTALYEQVQERRIPAKQAKQQSKKRTQDKPLHSDGDTPYGLQALENECSELASKPEGGRNAQLNISAYKIGRLVGGHELTQPTAERALTDAARQTGLPESEIEKTLRSGIQAGISEPRSAPAATKRNGQKSQDRDITEEFKREYFSNDGTGNQANEQKQSDLPEVIVGSQLRYTTYFALKNIALAESKKRTIFVQAGSYKLVRVCKDKKGRPALTPMGVPEIKHAMTHSADYYSVNAKNEMVNTSPPKEVAEQILSLPPDEWPFPMIEAIVEIPQMRPDGSILDTPGYDEVTQLYYMPHPNLAIPAIPTTPTKADIEQAVTFIAGFLDDFPWVSSADRANAFGLWFTTVLRQRIRHVPMALINATAPGTGKGLLTDGTALLATGQTASSLSQVDSDEEWDKRITATLLAGATFISIDNVEKILHSSILSKSLTMDYHKGRILGISKMVDVPQRAIWVANGNNIQLGGDMPRRCYYLNMAVQISDPWTRDDFKYPNLIQAITEQRGKIIAALLTIARAWVNAGQPEPKTKLKKLGTFSEWVELVGGILSYAGIDEFLGNLTEMHQKADIEGKAWAIFLETWLDKLGDKEYKTAKELIEKWKEDSEFADVLPDPIATWFQDDVKTIKNKVGKLLAKREARPYGEKNLRIVKSMDTDAKIATYKVTGYTGSTGLNSNRSGLENSEKNLPLNGNNIESGHDAELTPYPTYTPYSMPTTEQVKAYPRDPDTYLPKWLIVGTDDWNKQVKLCGMADVQERRRIAIEQHEAGAI